MNIPRGNPRPSRVQLEVLKVYVESGRTVDGVAELRGTSSRNIADRLRQARIRLGAVTTAQAYAIAVREGLIRADSADLT